MTKKGSATLLHVLAVYMSTDSDEVIAHRQGSMQVISTLILKPRANVNRIQNKGISSPTKSGGSI